MKKSSDREFKMNKEIRVKRAVKYFSLLPAKKQSIPEIVLAMHDAVKKVDFDAANVDLTHTSADSFTSFVSAEWKKEQKCPEVGLMFEYVNGGRSIPELYDDYGKFDLEKLAKQEGFLVKQANAKHWATSPGPSLRILFTQKHHLHFPIELSFKDWPEIDVQKNEAHIFIRSEINDDERAGLEKLCKDEDCEVEIITGSLARELDENGLGSEFFFKDNSVTWGSVSPETRVRLKWDGSNFDYKAINMYGKVGEFLCDNYFATSLKYAKAVMNRYCRKPGHVILNQEERNEHPLVPDFICHMLCKIPVKEGVVAHIAYRFFRGYG